MIKISLLLFSLTGGRQNEKNKNSTNRDKPIFSHENAIFESLKKQKEKFEIIGCALPENERQKIPEYMRVFGGYRGINAEETNII